MLTFEDFFKKKKIDLQHLQQAEPLLFAEFSKHYPLMGEKSFDQVKKYWFNSLRRNYPASTPVKPHAVQAEAISQMAVQGLAVAAAQNLNEAIERPKFKEDNLAELTEPNVPEEDVSLTENEKNILEKPETNPENNTLKPAFKPRFNAKNIKKSKPEVATEPATENLQPTPEPAKPAFKPRFNMQNTKKEPVKEVSETENQKPEAEVKVEPATENPQPKTEEAKAAYKPRFQMKNIQKPAAGNPPPEKD